MQLQLIELAAVILENQTSKSDMQTLGLQRLCLEKGDELAEEEKMLVNAMLNSPISIIRPLYVIRRFFYEK